MKWTASKVDLLKSRLARKWKADEIASSFGISENAVAKKAQSLGLSLKGGAPLKRSNSKVRTRGERMGLNLSQPMGHGAPAQPMPTETDADKPLPEGELKHEDGGVSWTPTPR